LFLSRPSALRILASHRFGNGGWSPFFRTPHSAFRIPHFSFTLPYYQMASVNFYPTGDLTRFCEKGGKSKKEKIWCLDSRACGTIKN
jgi:hypothetical protein